MDNLLTSIDREPSIVIQLLPSDLKKELQRNCDRREEGETPNDRNDPGIISDIS